MLKIAWNPIYAHPLPPGHRFPMIKYELLPQQLLHEGTVKEDNFFDPVPAEDEIILQTHDLNYLEKLRTGKLTADEIRRSGFPYSFQLFNREILITGGTIRAAQFALKYGVAMNIAGGTHHAFRNKGEGFCLLNDQAIAANYLLKNKLVQKILIVDLDVHQGNGTAEIFSKEKRIFTFSMHGARNYPLQKEKSDLDIPLPDKTGDKEYLELLKVNLMRLIETFDPDFIFYQAGVDVLSTDKLGRLGLSIDGCKRRDRLVISTCFESNIPLVICMGGGYSESIRLIIEAHSNTFRIAQEIFF